MTKEEKREVFYSKVPIKPWNKKIYLCGSHLTQVYSYSKIQNAILPSSEKQYRSNKTDYVAECLFQDKLLIDKINNHKDNLSKVYDNTEIKKMRNDKSNSINKRNKLIRLINSNPQLTNFVTLTYSDNVTSFECSASIFDDFRRRINKYMLETFSLKFEYVAVIEFQKRGAIHYHLLCNLPCDFIPNRDSKLKSDDQKYYEWQFGRNMWQNGFVGIQPLTPNEKYGDDVDNVGAYLVKYMTKELDNPSVINQKMYRCSQGLVKPIEIKILDMGDNSNLGLPTFSNSYDSVFTGHVVFQEFNSKRTIK
jgi:hypothetical protein